MRNTHYCHERKVLNSRVLEGSRVLTADLIAAKGREAVFSPLEGGSGFNAVA